VTRFVENRYSGWSSDQAQEDVDRIGFSLEQIAARVEADNINPAPRSGKQEWLENVVNRFV
jgi:xylose isomerase